MNSFSEMQLSPQVLKGVDSMGYQHPFPIQERAIGPLMKGRNLIGQAKAGSGKTVAFGIPLIEAINLQEPRVQALVLAPTRELAVQITGELKKIGAYTGIRVVTIYGGQSMNLQLDALRRGAHVVVGTPGRLIDHLRRGTIKLSSVRFVVLDEADTMLDMGFIDDVDFILSSTSRDRQLSLFSATMPRRIIQLSDRYMKDPERVMVDEDAPSAETLEQFYAVVGREEKLELVLQLLKQHTGKSTVIFCRTRHGTIRLARDLQKHSLNVAQLHGNLSQHQRDRSMHQFRSGDADVLVATDVASRGIDVRHIGSVINYDVPEDPTVYFHRVGRTARAGDAGISCTLVTREEAPDFGRILSLAKAPIKPLREADGNHTFESRSDAPSGGSRYRRYRPRGRSGGRTGRWKNYR